MYRGHPHRSLIIHCKCLVQSKLFYFSFSKFPVCRHFETWHVLFVVPTPTRSLTLNLVNVGTGTATKIVTVENDSWENWNVEKGKLISSFGEVEQINDFVPSIDVKQESSIIWEIFRSLNYFEKSSFVGVLWIIFFSRNCKNTTKRRYIGKHLDFWNFYC